MMATLPKFTVCMSVYMNSKSDEFLTAFDSVVCQSAPPDEIILIIDGPIRPELESAIQQISSQESLRIIRLQENKGLGTALKIGVENASNDWIARMDSDDVSLPERFSLQLKYIQQHPEVDILGGQITEFVDKPENIIGKREVPLDNDAIYSYMKKRCAMNHPTVIFRKEAVIKAGNYQDWFLNEDYYLWIRMVTNKCIFANLDNVLVNIRVNKELYARRGGWKYFKSEAGLQNLMRDLGMISWFRKVFNISARFFVQILLSNKLRATLYQSLFRNKANE